MGIELGLGLLISAIASAASTGVGVWQAKKAQSAQEKAQKKAEAQADEATNRANRKTPDASMILKAAQKAGSGLSSTMLTGPGGVDPASLSLGKSTLLGG